MKNHRSGDGPLLLLLAGTADGRELAGKLAADGYRVIASAVTGYGSELLERIPGVEVHRGALDASGLAELITDRGIGGILDATHPFATRITRLAREVAACHQVPYLRWERPPARLPRHPLIRRVSNWSEAVEELVRLRPEKVFLAVGVKPLKYFIREPRLAASHFIVKLLPVAASLEEAFRLGLTPAEVVAFQGAGSARLLEALLASYGAQALVTKESGSEGGVAEKADAAIKRGIPLVLVERPAVGACETADSWTEVLRWADRLTGRD